MHVYISNTPCGRKHVAKCISEKSYGIALLCKKGSFPYYEITDNFKTEKGILPQGLRLTSRIVNIILVGLGLKVVKAGGP